MVSQGAVAQSAFDPWAVQSRVGLADARLALDSVLMPRPNLSYIDYRSGVMASGDSGATGTPTHMAMRVAPVANALSVTVEMGNCVINSPGQGAYMCALDGQKTLNLAAASSTQNRIDLIVARVYDDLNTAIGSASGVRKFTVEVWQGDYSSGTPTVPTPTPTNGWTPLAAVTVGKNATSLTAATIQDLRGPGLVARGGMRALYGDDAKTASAAFAEPGAYPGDQRWVHAPGFQHQVYYGAQQGWRGAFNCVRYFAAAPPGEYSFTAGYGVTREICRVTIQDPGVPYFVFPTGKASITMTGGCAADLRVTTGSIDGAIIQWTRFHTYGSTADKLNVPNVAPTHWGPITGNVDIVLSVGMRDNVNQNSGFGYRGNDVGANTLNCLVFPATTQPPAV
ncbi:hypothetical protein [Amycolatopsis sp. NPDC004079]|uniref:hypothetical protein n=1 Tax=Amycolatopsis sp. NPDC004079 TaxID=3154549 RepID=UPI0033A8DA15